jgi:thiol:disulfide interchange protein DsbD
MKQLIAFFALYLVSIHLLQAQDNKPVVFSFTTERMNDSVAYLHINVKLDQSTKVFSTRKRNSEDPFISQINFDSASTPFINKNDTVIEKGKLVLTDDSITGKATRLFGDSVVFSYPIHTNTRDTATVSGIFTALLKKGAEYPPYDSKFNVTILPANKSQKTQNEIEGKSIAGIFWLCFITGMLAVLTPCVFPLIPVTVSFFLKRSKTRAQGVSNSVWYSISIILIYTIPTIALTKIFGDTILYKISTHPVTNLLFFIIFIVFGISLLGGFELTLPSKWANSADQQAGKGGWRGIFFMALTLVIVSFSCTGPIVGLLLGSTSQGGNALQPIIGMLGFGIGLALPFTLFAFFPSFMQSLPKSGGWLNSVKVVFGFIELALALKFLSSVDLIYHWHLLNREVFLSIWISITLLASLYLLGKLKFSHDSDITYVGIPRLFFAIAFLSFTVYLIPGLWGAPLKVLSGVIPPSTTQEFNLDDLQYKIGSSQSASSSLSLAKPPKKLIDKLHVPFGLTAYFDLDEGLAASKALNKPVMLDFTGHSCSNCRKMEEEVWKNPEVLKRMKDDFVLVSLYVDESTELPIKEQYTNSNGESITTVGGKNLDYEISKFGFNAQPLYMFLDSDGKPLSDVKYGYDSDVQKFLAHLEEVKKAYHHT